MKTQFGVSAAGSRSWNKLPSALCVANSINYFKLDSRPICSAVHTLLLVDL